MDWDVSLKGTASAVPHHAPERNGALALEVQRLQQPTNWKSRPATKTVAALVAIVLVAFGGLAWWWHAWDLSDPYVAGTYVTKQYGQQETVHLKTDHTFTQKIERANDSIANASGRWNRSGEGGIVFSKDFIGAAADVTMPDGEVYGVLDSSYGIRCIRLDSPIRPLKFHKKFFN